MSDERTAIVKRFWELMEARDWSAARALLSPDFVAEWPQSSERFPSADAFMAMNQAHPAPNWHISSLSVQMTEHDVVAEVLVTNDEGADVAIGFYEVQGGLMTRAREYWVPKQIQPTPPWRAAWTEAIEAVGQDDTAT
jgi:ketosteroid isomerase-like protein